VNQSELLQRMCHGVLTVSDLKAISKARRFPASAANPGIMTGLFLTEQGLADSFRSLDRQEIGVLHLLKAIGKPVNITFFERLYSPAHGLHLTFTQKYQGVLAKVKERLVRAGVLLMFDVRANHREAKAELWRFMLPTPFHPHLPPIFDSLRTWAGPGDCRTDVVRQRLIEDLAGEASQMAGKAPRSDDKRSLPRFDIANGELQLGGRRFCGGNLSGLRIALWTEQVADQHSKGSSADDPTQLDPANAVFQLLEGLGTDQWADVKQLSELAAVFAGRPVDCHAVCEAGRRLGLLAKCQVDGTNWYRPAPAEPHRAPDEFLRIAGREKRVVVDLERAPLPSLETLGQLSNATRVPSGPPGLLLSPSLVRLGRANDELLATEEAAWLFRHSPLFQQAGEVRAGRRGRTVLHDDILIARVTDLSLKVALEKALGEQWASLKNDYVAFPRGALGDVQRIVRKSGHVIKEVFGHAR
jgi:hypothetical protein